MQAALPRHGLAQRGGATVSKLPGPCPWLPRFNVACGVLWSATALLSTPHLSHTSRPRCPLGPGALVQAGSPPPRSPARAHGAHSQPLPGPSRAGLSPAAATSPRPSGSGLSPTKVQGPRGSSRMRPAHHCLLAQLECVSEGNTASDQFLKMPRPVTKKGDRCWPTPPSAVWPECLPAGDQATRVSLCPAGSSPPCGVSLTLAR